VTGSLSRILWTVEASNFKFNYEERQESKRQLGMPDLVGLEYNYHHIPPHHKALLQLVQYMPGAILGEGNADTRKILGVVGKAYWETKELEFFSELVTQAPHNHWKAFGHMRKYAQMQRSAKIARMSETVYGTEFSDPQNAPHEAEKRINDAKLDQNKHGEDPLEIKGWQKAR
jgi:hypothetical protein